MISNNSRLLFARKDGVVTFFDKVLLSMFDKEGNVYLDAEYIDGELFLYDEIGNFCLNKKELKNGNN